MLRFVKAIRKGSPVGILIDLTLKINDPGAIISSFGLQRRTTMLLAVLHDRTGARLFLFITLARPGGGYSVRLLDLPRFPLRSDMRGGSVFEAATSRPSVRSGRSRRVFSYPNSSSVLVLRWAGSPRDCRNRSQANLIRRMVTCSTCSRR
jgi:hypothetical protein